jgi:hypothetical protein
MAMTRTILEQDLPDELPKLRKRFPRLVENFEALQKVMAPFGVPSTLRVTTPDPAGTATVRFIFLKQDNNPPIAGADEPGAAPEALGRGEGSTEQGNLK